MKEDVHAAIVIKHSGARIWCPVVQNLYEHCRQAVREYAGPTSGLCLFPCLQLEGASKGKVHARADINLTSPGCPFLTWVPLGSLHAGPHMLLAGLCLLATGARDSHVRSPRRAARRMLLTGLWSNA